MTNKFVILHLSDAHIGKSVGGIDEEIVLSAKHREDVFNQSKNKFSSGGIIKCSGAKDTELCLNTEACISPKQYDNLSDLINNKPYESSEPVTISIDLGDPCYDEEELRAIDKIKEDLGMK